MDILISNASGEPIYEQIVSQIKRLILNGTLLAGDALPSMRALAQQLRISVITTKRAYEALEAAGYIESYVGRGCFVKGQNTALLREESLRQTEELLCRACKLASMSGITLPELQEMLEMEYEGISNEII